MCFLRCAQAEFNNGSSIFVLSEIDFLCKISATSVQQNMSKPFSKVLKWFGKPFRGIHPWQRDGSDGSDATRRVASLPGDATEATRQKTMISGPVLIRPFRSLKGPLELLEVP